MKNSHGNKILIKPLSIGNDVKFKVLMTTSDKRKITIYCNKIKNGYLRRSERLEEETEESDVSDSESE